MPSGSFIDENDWFKGKSCCDEGQRRRSGGKRIRTNDENTEVSQPVTSSILSVIIELLNRAETLFLFLRILPVIGLFIALYLAASWLFDTSL